MYTRMPHLPVTAVCLITNVLYAMTVTRNCIHLSVLSQEIGWEERLRNDLFYVEWHVKP